MLFPIPVHLQYNEGNYSLGHIAYQKDLAQFYQSYKEQNPDVSYTQNPQLKEEEYILDVTADGIAISYATEQGKFRALTTLRQMVKESTTISCCHIQDYPHIPRRSYMIDISGGRVPRVETFKWLIDLLADLKYNELQIYMASIACFKYAAFPEQTKDIDILTPEDIQELERYCEERFIELVPNQNSMGHMHEWLDHEEFAHLGLGDGSERMTTLNPLDERTYEFIEKIYDGLLPNFKSKYVMIGLDEADGLGRFQTEEICKEQGIENVFVDYLNRLADLCKTKYGKTAMFFSDMLRPYPEGYFRIKDKDLIPLCWGYDLLPTQKTEKRVMDIVKAGHRFYVCPGNCTWLAYTGRFDTMNFNVRTMAEIARDHGALGYLMCDWSSCEDGHVSFMVWGLVPAALAGQFAWDAAEYQNGGKLKKRFTHAAERYIDENYFDGESVSKHLRRMQQFYMLEPERIHNGTMAGYSFMDPLPETKSEYGCFDLAECGDDYYFDNVIAYMKKNLEVLSQVKLAERWRREITLNVDMVILATELMKIRYHGTVTAEKKAELVAFMDRLQEEFTELWLYRNYKAGSECFLNRLAARRAELLAM